MAAIFALFISGTLIAIVFALTAIFIPKIKLSMQTKNSAGAFYAADSAMEWCLYIKYKTPAGPYPALPIMANGAVFTNAATGAELAATDCLNWPFKISGVYLGVNRALEVSE